MSSLRRLLKAVSGFGSKMGSTVPPRSGNGRVRDKAGGGDQEEDTSQVPVTQLVAAYTPLFLAKRALYDAAAAEKLGRGGGKEKVEAAGEDMPAEATGYVQVLWEHLLENLRVRQQTFRDIRLGFVFISSPSLSRSLSDHTATHTRPFSYYTPDLCLRRHSVCT